MLTNTFTHHQRDRSTQPLPAADLWQRVHALASRAPTLNDLRYHRIHLLAARQWRSLGRAVPEQLQLEEQAAAMINLAAAFALQRVRSAVDGRIVVMKGPDVAAYYPHPADRPFRDLDLLVDDAARVQKALLRAGFVAVGDERLYTGIHHLQPLQWPDVPVVVEIHEQPKWIDGLEPPSTGELLDHAVPSRTSVPGTETLAPEHHAIVLAVHSWAHVPLSRIGHLADVAALLRDVDRARVDAIAEAWGVGRVWSATVAAVDGLFGSGRASFAVRTWARNVARGRERNVLESHLEQWLSPFLSEPPLAAVGTSARALRRDLFPAEGEEWRVKRARVLEAIRAPRRPLSEHYDTLEVRSIAGPGYLERLDRRQ